VHGTIQRRQRKRANASCAPSLQKIVVRLEGNDVHLVLHWQGGDPELKVPKPRNGEHRWALDATTTEIISELTRLMPDMSIAALLNRAVKRTGRDNPWTESVCACSTITASPDDELDFGIL
jgi:hypothetical protein